MTEPEWTPIEAMQWLKRKSKRLKIGGDPFLSVLTALRTLVEERAKLNVEIERLESDVARLQRKKLRAPYEVDGQGGWDEINLT